MDARVPGRGVLVHSWYLGDVTGPQAQAVAGVVEFH